MMQIRGSRALHEREGHDAAICVGASFIWDGLPATLAALDPAVRDGGFIAVGEAYWRWADHPDL